MDSRSNVITPDMRSVGVSIATWFLTSTFLVMYLSGQTVKYVMLGRLRVDDYLLLFATILGLGLSISYSVAASNGLGNTSSSDGEIEAMLKALYAANMLYIAAACCVKLSLFSFLRNLTVYSKLTRVFLGLAAFTLLGAFGFNLEVMLRCRPPETWETLSLRCFSQTGFWVCFGVLDILTDLAVVFGSAVLVWDTHLPLSRKAVVVGCFAPRILVVAVAACRLGYLVRAARRENLAFELWPWVVCGELQICLSISSACIPSVKPLFAAIESGVWQADDLRRRGLSLADLHSRGYLNQAGSYVELGEITTTRGPGYHIGSHQTASVGLH